jgi:hypothetical protein
MRHNVPPSPIQPARDAGSVLPLVLVISVVLSVMVAGLAGYVTTGLRYGSVVEERADRLAAADGGMRYAVERLKLGASRICATAGGDTIDPPDTNGATVTVTCSQVGSGFDDTNGWAMILTGEEAPAAEPLIKTQSGVSVNKLVGGPVYMSRLGFDTSAPLQFRYSQLLYTGSDSNGDSAVDCDATPSIPANVTFDSTSLGLACTTRPWSRDANPKGLFSEPNKGVLPTNMNPSASFVGSCKVFEPGHYTVQPTLGSHNYFRSGNYIFDGFKLEVRNAKVTAGRAAGDGSDGSAQFIPNTTCNTARNTDKGTGVTTSGATFYLRNHAGFVLGANGTFEVMRRKQGRSYVGIHVLDDSFTYDENVILQGPGTNKDMVMHGLIWAPEARVTFDLVTNTANGQFLGGGVLSNVILESSASSVGFIIAVEPSDLQGKIQLDSVAELDGKSTTIRSIVDYRPTTGYTAVTSWRVID